MGRQGLARPSTTRIQSPLRLGPAALAECSREWLWKKVAERLMVGRICDIALIFPLPSHFLIGIALCGGAKKQLTKDSTDFLHSLASAQVTDSPPFLRIPLDRGSFEVEIEPNVSSEAMSAYSIIPPPVLIMSRDSPTTCRTGD